MSNRTADCESLNDNGEVLESEEGIHQGQENKCDEKNETIRSANMRGDRLIMKMVDLQGADARCAGYVFSV